MDAWNAVHPVGTEVLVLLDNGSKFRTKTTAQIRQYQKEQGLKVDGIVGPATWAKACEVVAAKNLVEEMVELIQAGQDLLPQDFTRSAKMIENGNLKPADVLSQSILSSRGKTIRPKTLGQKLYLQAIQKNPIVFGIGPAGTA